MTRYDFYMLRGTPHAHICIFLYPDDKLKNDIDNIDQTIWAEIPIDYQSGEFEQFLENGGHVMITVIIDGKTKKMIPP